MNIWANEISVILHFSAFVYCLYIFVLILSWFKVKNAKGATDFKEESFSLLIPFRNEESNLSNIIKDLMNQNFSSVLQRIYLVNDHSSDSSIEEINKLEHSLPIKIISLENGEQGKKAAISKAWKLIKSDWIIQLDADVRLPENWFQELHKNYDPSAYMNILPLQFHGKNPIQKLFAFEFLSISMITFATLGIKKPVMANAAHLMYRKDNLSSITQRKIWKKISSGDDTAILQHFNHQRKKISALLLSGVVASTEAESSLSKNLKQRLRWAGKTKGELFSFSGINALFFLLSNLLLIFSFFLLFSESHIIIGACVFIAAKIISDFFFFLPTLDFFRKMRWLRIYFLLVPIYPIYIVLIVILSIIGKGKWKGREIKLN